MAKTIFHIANSRGNVDLGWLKSNHTFSFGNYYNPERINFGALRVLNDDTVAGGKGFGTHPHDNMEIISIPLGGGLKHHDSMDNIAVMPWQPHHQRCCRQLPNHAPRCARSSAGGRAKQPAWR